ncbi:MAG: DUF615 domain-containing protein [Clostridia bacterium]|nr:DUF615 domain-containing protein [Clostridia bacterium]
MANSNQEASNQNTTPKIEQSPKIQKNNNKKEGKGKLLYGVLAFLTAIVIMAIVFGGVFYIVVSNNVNGIGEKYRKDIQSIPVLKMALPKVKDPDDDKYLTESEVRNKYRSLRKDKSELTTQLEEAKKKAVELQKQIDELTKVKAENEKIKKDMEFLKAQIENEKKQLAEDKKKIDELVAAGDKNGFKEYFEKVDKDTAQKLYAQIVQEQKISEEAKKFTQIYENMEPASAAGIFEQMGDTKLDLVIEIMKAMKKETSSQVLAEMTPDFAGKVTEKLSKLYLNKDNSTKKSN